jgi:hypothetical protein
MQLPHFGTASSHYNKDQRSTRQFQSERAERTLTLIRRCLQAIQPLRDLVCRRRSRGPSRKLCTRSTRFWWRVLWEMFTNRSPEERLVVFQNAVDDIQTVGYPCRR